MERWMVVIPHIPTSPPPAGTSGSSLGYLRGSGSPVNAAVSMLRISPWQKSEVPTGTNPPLLRREQKKFKNIGKKYISPLPFSMNQLVYHQFPADVPAKLSSLGVSLPISDPNPHVHPCTVHPCKSL